MLRPEFVLKNSEPLNSDAFTAWGKHDPNHGKHNAMIEAATERYKNSQNIMWAQLMND